ncbi:hypothetical protein Hanom_Chr06g00534331 [Helianthus anomalus]
MTSSQSQSSEPENQGNRDQSQPAGNLTGDCPSRVLERPQSPTVIMEGAVNNQSGIFGKFEVTKNPGDSIEADKETYMNYGDLFLGGNLVDRERGPLAKNNRNISKKKKNRTGRIGPVQAKLVSVDVRPGSRKRPRLDVDPNGFDAFGLNALLGLNICQHKEFERFCDSGNVEGNENSTPVNIGRIMLMSSWSAQR